MTRAELLTELRETVNDSPTNGAWRESLLLSFLAEGQDKFCEQTGFFVDRSNYTVELVADTESYAIDERIIEVMDVWNGATRLGKFEERDRTEGVGTAWFPFTTSARVGAPSCWQSDRETGKITVYPVPTSTEAGTVLTLRVWRYSRTALDAATGEPEIPARFHRAPLDWACFRCFSQHDAESFDPQEASRHKTQFDQYVIEGASAFRRLSGSDVRVGTDPAYRT
jgi:hypothetical protein